MSDDSEPKPVAKIGLAHQTVPIETPPSVLMRMNAAIASALITAVYLPPTRESALVRTKLDEALMWLGRVQEKTEPTKP